MKSTLPHILFSIVCILKANFSAASLKETPDTSFRKLCIAIEKQDAKTALKLLDNITDVNKKTCYAELPTLLHLATHEWMPEVIRKLVERDADTEAFNNRGHLPIDVRPEDRTRDDWNKIISGINSKQ